MDHPLPDADVHAVKDALCRYLADRPQAADTAQGIQRWWLAPRFGEVALATVQAALDQLLAEGVIERRTSPWSDAVYAMAAGPGSAASSGETAH
jgi:Fe2+ or Zn2+ uptake regulation protein